MGTATINAELWGARAEAWSLLQQSQCRTIHLDNTLRLLVTRVARGQSR